jgi:hypothetical protein
MSSVSASSDSEGDELPSSKRRRAEIDGGNESRAGSVSGDEEDVYGEDFENTLI